MGTLYIVATPLGHLDDLTLRACDTLNQVDLICAEDTRHSRTLLQHHGITTPVTALHEHNEQQKSQHLIDKLNDGADLALISDAGTPLISDPGQHLITAAIAADIRVCPLPGPSAAIAALSAAGLATDHFLFEGFLPARPARRQKQLLKRQHETATLIYYEAKHRLLAFLTELSDTFGAERPAVIAREISKQFEEFQRGSLQSLHQHYQQHPDTLKGEFVILVQGSQDNTLPMQVSADHILAVLAKALPPAKAASLTAKIVGGKKSDYYAKANHQTLDAPD